MGGGVRVAGMHSSSVRSNNSPVTTLRYERFEPATWPGVGITFATELISVLNEVASFAKVVPSMLSEVAEG